MSRFLSLSLMLAASALLAGCGTVFKATCAKPEDYASAVDNGPLKVPAGLQGPDTRGALAVPPLQEPERPRAADEPCLDAPPRYTAPAPAKPAA
jgi:uncharacterized lipoprotein